MRITGKKYILPILSLLAAILLLTGSCRDALNDCMRGPGNVVTERMGLYAFGNVKVENNIDLILEKGDHFEMEVTGGENVIHMLGVEITDNTLHLSNESTCPMFKDPWKGIAIRLIVPDLDTVFVESHGMLTSLVPFKNESLVVRLTDCPANVDLQVECDFFRIENISGTGDIKVSGRSTRAECFHAGYGIVDLATLNSKYMNLNIQSTNNSWVRAGDYYFYVVISDIGNVYYYNNPDRIELFTHSSGKLIRLYE